MLKMVAVQGPSASGADYSIQELKSFLDIKIKQGELTLSDSLYRLPDAH